MNYRHAFHAGAFSDCMKHALLVWLIDALQRKPAPICVLDTHAGAGAYDLSAGPAERTGEWRGGIGRLLDDPPQALARYVGLVRQLGLYPGSPALIRALLRPGDRLVCCELHTDDAAALRRRFARDSQVAVHHRDAWEGLGALLPPRERLPSVAPASAPASSPLGIRSSTAPRCGTSSPRCNRPASATSLPRNSACANRSIPRG
jgi:23S rRNA (adenine2030-N6)-methyltransferase